MRTLGELLGIGFMKLVQVFYRPVTRITRTYDTEATKVLKEGDVVLFRGKKTDVLSAGICYFTKSPYTHAEIYVGDGWSLGASLNGISLNDTLGSGKIKGMSSSAWLDIYRYRGGLNKTQERIVLGKAYQQIAKPYAIIDGVIGFPWPSRAKLAHRGAYAAFGCSEFVSFCFEKAGVPLSPNAPPLVAPADLGQSPQLEYVCSVYNGKLRTDKRQFANKHDPETQPGKWHWLSRLLVNWFIKPTSVRDEFYASLHEMYERTQSQK